MIPSVRATRYVTPLREGGSLPGVVEADDFGTYVVKFRGAGQGLKVLVAEVVVGELARRLGIATPDLVAIELDRAIAKYEADEEVQDLLTASVGVNLGVDFLPGSFGWDPNRALPHEQGAAVLWLDAFTANVDRTWRNPNVLIWHRALWVIDHGAALYFHHGWSRGSRDPASFAAQPYDASEHIMLPHAGGVPDADARLAPLVTASLLTEVLAQVPAEWLEPITTDEARLEPDQVRQLYVDYLLARVSGERVWLPGRSA